MQRTPVKKCRFCGEEYDDSNTGKLECFYHPSMFVAFGNTSGVLDFSKFGREHYICCGASHRKQDHLHYEHNLVRGCTRIDHCNTEDYNAIRSKSYILTELKQARLLYPVLKQTTLPANVYIFHTEKDVPASLDLNAPAIKNNKIQLLGADILNEYTKLSKERLSLILSNFKKANYIEANRFVTFELIESFLEESGEEGQHQVRLLLETKQALENHSFQPFCLIQRVGSLDPERIKSFNGNSLCTLQLLNERMNSAPSSPQMPLKKRKFV
jgi:hypothetical protein